VLGLIGRSRSRPRIAVGFNVLLVGGVLMCAQIAFLLTFQVLAGFVYLQVALIVALFMVGLALGAALVSALADHLRRARLWLAACQGALCLFLIAIAGVFQVLHHWLDSTPNAIVESALTIVFAVMALVLGLLGGIHFSLSVSVQAGSTLASERIGGSLYALDLLGAAGGALVSSLFLLPSMAFSPPCTFWLPPPASACWPCCPPLELSLKVRHRSWRLMAHDKSKLWKEPGKPNQVEDHDADGQAVQPGRHGPAEVHRDVALGHFILDHLQQRHDVLVEPHPGPRQTEVIRGQFGGMP